MKKLQIALGALGLLFAIQVDAQGCRNLMRGGDFEFNVDGGNQVLTPGGTGNNSRWNRNFSGNAGGPDLFNSDGTCSSDENTCGLICYDTDNAELSYNSLDGGQGGGYAGFGIANRPSGADNFEYMFGELSNDMQAGAVYTVSFRIALTDCRNAQIENLGIILFDDAGNDITEISTTARLTGTSDFTFSDMNASVGSWVEIGPFLYTADGGENHIGIGAFDEAVLGSGDQLAYYNLDDVVIQRVRDFDMADADYCPEGTASATLTACDPNGFSNYSWYTSDALIAGEDGCDYTAGPGAYTVLKYRTSNGCPFMATANIAPSAPINISLTSSVGDDCSDECTGQAVLDIAGEGQVTYEYDGSQQATIVPSHGVVTINELCEGDHTITARDGNGCSTTFTFTIGGPTNNVVVTESTVDVSCDQANNGAASVVASGGEAPYTYLWSNGSEEQDVHFLTEGTYTVVVTDANGCSTSHDVEIGNATGCGVESVDFDCTTNQLTVEDADGTTTDVDLSCLATDDAVTSGAFDCATSQMTLYTSESNIINIPMDFSCLPDANQYVIGGDFTEDGLNSQLTLSMVDGTTFDIPMDLGALVNTNLYVTAGSFNEDGMQSTLILTLNDGSQVNVPMDLGDLANTDGFVVSGSFVESGDNSVMTLTMEDGSSFDIPMNLSGLENTDDFVQSTSFASNATGGNLVITMNSGTVFNTPMDLSSLITNDDFVQTGVFSYNGANSALVLTMASGATVPVAVDLSAIPDENDYVDGMSVSGNTLTLTRTGSLSDLTVNLPAGGGSGAADADWFKRGTTDPSTAITEEIYTKGGVAVGMDGSSAGAIMANEAVAQFRTGSGAKSAVVFDHYTGVGTSEIPNVSNTRMIWMANKQGAIRAGFNGLSAGNNTSGGSNAVGQASAGFGRNTSAQGHYSFAAGYETSATGEYSFAMGSNSSATKTGAVVFGRDNKASGAQTLVQGFNNEASGDNSVSFGNGNLAKGTNSIASGKFTSAGGLGSASFGTETAASGNYSSAFGYKSSTAGYYTMAVGNNTTATGTNAFAAGIGTHAEGVSSATFGSNTSAIGTASLAVGATTTARGTYSFAAGNTNVAEGASSAVFGHKNMSVGQYSFVTGRECAANADESSAFGFRAKANGQYSMAVGNTTTALGVGSFASGYTTEANGAYSAGFGKESEANGIASFVGGYHNLVNGGHSASFGQNNVIDAIAVNSFAVGSQIKLQARGTFALGRGHVVTGEDAMSFGYFNTNSGLRSIVIGQNSTNTTDESVEIGYNNSHSLHVQQHGTGVGNNTPGNKLDVTQKTTGVSGLRLRGLDNSSGCKYLTVNANGDVILQDLSACSSAIATNPANDDVTALLELMQERMNKMEEQLMDQKAEISELKAQKQVALDKVNKLMQNVPNPVSGSSDISYELAEAGYVELRIMNRLGQVLECIDCGDRAAGKHTVTWFADGLANGTYFYTLVQNGQELTKKAVVLQ